MSVSVEAVRELRDRTNAGLMDCKSALTEAEGDQEKAIEILRKKGAVKAAKKAGRIAAEGAVGSYIHLGGKIGVLVEVNCETAQSAKTDAFQNLVAELAMQVAAANPLYVSSEDIPAELLAKEKAFHLEEVKASGKPEKIIDQIVTGKMRKWFEQICLLEQPYIREDKRKVASLIEEITGQISEKVVVRRFARYELGEGLDKPESCDAE
jgi:elongation factor Ts